MKTNLIKVLTKRSALFTEYSVFRDAVKSRYMPSNQGISSAKKRHKFNNLSLKLN